MFGDFQANPRNPRLWICVSLGNAMESRNRKFSIAFAKVLRVFLDEERLRSRLFEEVPGSFEPSNATDSRFMADQVEESLVLFMALDARPRIAWKYVYSRAACSAPA